MFVYGKECKKRTQCRYSPGVASVGYIPLSGSFEKFMDYFQRNIVKCGNVFFISKTNKNTDVTVVCGDTVFG